MELAADAAHVLDMAGPGHDHSLCRAAEVRWHLLHPFERRVHRPCPRRRKVRERLVGAPERVPEQLRLDRHGNAVERGELVRCAVEHAFGARAVVATDVDDQRVVEFAEVLDRLDDPPDLMIGVGEVGPIDVRLPDEQLLLVEAERIPARQLRAAVDCLPVRPLGELCVRRHDAQALLVREDGLAQLVPAIVEQVHRADLVDPLLRRVMRGVGCARHVVDEERLVRRERLELLHVVNGVIGHRCLRGSSRACPGRGRWPSCCGTGSAATGWHRRRRSRRSSRSPCRSATG